MREQVRRTGPGILETMSAYGPGIAAAHMQQLEAEKQASQTTIETFRKLEEEEEKDENLSLGEINPLIHNVDFSNRPVLDSLTHVTLEMIESHGGVKPVKLGAEPVSSADGKKIEPRFIARFEVDSLSDDQFDLLESLVEETYPTLAVRTRKSSDKKMDIPAEEYPPTDKNQMRNTRTAGWYLGPGPMPTEALYPGLFAFKDFGELNSENLLTRKRGENSEEYTQNKWIVEIRDAGMFQTDLVEFITQVSSILGKGEKLPQGDLTYETYYKLMRLGLRDFDQSQVHGMEDEIAEIKRRLIYPLANPELSREISQKAESALLVGVPGTGKTLIAKYLLHEDTGTLIVPITPIDLMIELTAEPEKQRLLKRIGSVGRTTHRKVILHVDDIENVAEEESKSKSNLLNILAGVTDSGFQMIASTNEPEKISPALLQPERFGIILYTGLHDEEARREIIDIHAPREGAKKKSALFTSDEERGIILDEVARRTEGFTPRYLAEIATVAKSYLHERVARERGTHIALTEEDLGENRFTVEDWAKAVSQVSKGYDKEATLKRDKEIQAFVEHNRGNLGFKTVNADLFDPTWQEVGERIAAIRSRQEPT